MPRVGSSHPVLLAIVLPIVVSAAAPASAGSAASLLACGDVTSFARVESDEVLRRAAFESLWSWERFRTRPSATTDEFHRRTKEQQARDGITFLVGLTGQRCHACKDDGTIRWDALGDDLTVWQDAAGTHLSRAYQDALEAQRTCVLRLLNARTAELEAIAEAWRATGIGREPSQEAIPGEVSFACSPHATAVISLAPIQRRASWELRDLEAALEFARRCRAFMDRGTAESWRALVGAKTVAEYRALVGREAAAAAARMRGILQTLDDRIAHFEEWADENPDSELNADDALEVAALQGLAEAMASFGEAGPDCRKLQVRSDGSDRASVTVCIPKANLVSETFMAGAFPVRRDAFRAIVSRFRHDVDVAATIAEEGLLFEFTSRY